MSPLDGASIVENLWREVWQQPQNPDAIDRLVHEYFVITSGGRDIVGRQSFKSWVKDFQSRFTTFSSMSSRRSKIMMALASHPAGASLGNNGLMGTEPNGAAFEMIGTAIWEVGSDGLLRHNWVERNAFEVHGAITREDARANEFQTCCWKPSPDIEWTWLCELLGSLGLSQ